MEDDETPAHNDDGDFVSATQKGLRDHYDLLGVQLAAARDSKARLQARIHELVDERRKVERLLRATLPRGSRV